MKRFIQLVFLQLTAMLLPVVAFCQDVASLALEISGFDPAVYFVSLSALAGLVMVITQWVKKLLSSKGIGTKLLSWLVSVALAFCGWFFELGIFSGIEWYWVLAYGVGTGLIANSVVDNEIVISILNLFKPRKNG